MSTWRVESRMGASTDAGAPPRFPSPLIKPDVQISRIRLSDWLHRRLTNEAPSRLMPRDCTWGSLFALRYSLI